MEKTIKLPTSLNKPQIKLSKESIISFLLDNYEFELNSEKVRKRMINHLNSTFFYDNIAEFIDSTSDDDMLKGTISLMIRYNDTLYNLLAFEKFFLKINRMRKLNKLSERT